MFKVKTDFDLSRLFYNSNLGKFLLRKKSETRSKIFSNVKKIKTENHLIIVYQYGKVGSNSIVNTLNKVENVEAIQSHFLGEKRLIASLRATINPKTSPYFFQHRYGQLIENIKTTHRVNAHRSGMVNNETLNIITLSREPMNWFRSCILQDIQGYLPFFRRLAIHLGHSGRNDHQVISEGLRYFFAKAAIAIGNIPDLDTFIKSTNSDYRKTLYESGNPENIAWIDNNITMFLHMMLCPNTWFRDHVTEYLGVDITQMDRVKEGWLKYDLGWSNLHMIKYEMLSNVFQDVAEDIGILDEISLTTENVSESKMFSDAVSEGFNCDDARNLTKAIKNTATQKFLGYAV